MAQSPTNDANSYREQAERARRLSRGTTDKQASKLLTKAARDFEVMAEELEVADDLDQIFRVDAPVEIETA